MSGKRGVFPRRPLWHSDNRTDSPSRGMPLHVAQRTNCKREVSSRKEALIVLTDLRQPEPCSLLLVVSRRKKSFCSATTHKIPTRIPRLRSLYHAYSLPTCARPFTDSHFIHGNGTLISICQSRLGLSHFNLSGPKGWNEGVS